MTDFWKSSARAIHRAEEIAEKKAHDLLDMARHFFGMGAAGGIVLVFASILALIVANTPLFSAYDYLLNGIKFSIGFRDLQGSFDIEIRKPVLLWINDGLMAVFFLLVGLEIKREIVEGELSSRAKAILPAMAALGGMAAPAAVYWFINRDTPQNMAGWAIPAATDIAFALGVLGLLGSRAPVQLKILLTAIAIIDDIGAIVIIALFYSHQILLTPLFIAAVAIFVLFALNMRCVSSLTPYILTGIVLWMAVLESGIHATLAGVITAMFIPMNSQRRPGYSPGKELEHALHPWVAFGILPLFAFANAGVPFGGMDSGIIFDPLTMGIAAGLVIGKQAGVFLMLILCVALRLSARPEGTSWTQLYALSVLCGIGFTMSLFIGGLAFEQAHVQAAIRLGVLAGSVVSALAGYAILYAAGRGAQAAQ